MRNALGPGSTLGYCTNVHAGVTLDQVRGNLEQHAMAVKARVSPEESMGVGLWFAAEALAELATDEAVDAFGAWLAERGLLPFTLNGFPFADFHQPSVKDKVYLPDWCQADRYQYTLDLARLLARLLPEGGEGSISTLPLGWRPHFGRSDEERDERLRHAAAKLTDLVHALARIELDTGRHIYVNLEPEPGCVLDTADDVVSFFKDYLWGTADEPSVRGYLGVCHDVCHSAVMFEPQADAVAAYRAAGLRIGKAQLSSAVRVDFDSLDADGRAGALEALRGFCEDRYLHQTCVRGGDGGVRFYEDLPIALERAEAAGEWRVHFHVPVYLDEAGPLGTTRGDIAAFLGALPPGHDTHHFEVETYAWGVLPEELRVDTLADGIALEMRSVMGASG